MSNIYLNKLSQPIITGKPQTQTQPKTAQASPGEDGRSFQEVLREHLEGSGGVQFTKHAVSRVEERSIPISESSLTRLNEGVRLAQEKGLNETLIMVDNTAFIVNVKNGKVITTVDGSSLNGNVFTNIDGAVII